MLIPPPSYIIQPDAHRKGGIDCRLCIFIYPSDVAAFDFLVYLPHSAGVVAEFHVEPHMLNAHFAAEIAADFITLIEQIGRQVVD